MLISITHRFLLWLNRYRLKVILSRFEFSQLLVSNRKHFHLPSRNGLKFLKNSHLRHLTHHHHNFIFPWKTNIHWEVLYFAGRLYSMQDSHLHNLIVDFDEQDICVCVEDKFREIFGPMNRNNLIFKQVDDAGCLVLLSDRWVSICSVSNWVYGAVEVITPQYIWFIEIR